MGVAYTWTVAQMGAYPEYAGQTDVVFIVHWRLNGACDYDDDGDDEYTASVYGSVNLTLDPEGPFTPYADLTEAQVIGWVQDALGEEQVAAYEANVAAQIEAQINPPVVTPPLPWGV